MLKRTPEAIKRDRNAERFRWHEWVIRDSKLTASAVRLAGFIMHRFRADDGCAIFSHRLAAKKLRMAERTVIRARDLLQSRGWIYRLNGRAVVGFPNASGRYALGGGPEDLELAAHADADDSIATADVGGSRC
jgi:hypothetical protein